MGRKARGRGMRERGLIIKYLRFCGRCFVGIVVEKEASELTEDKLSIVKRTERRDALQNLIKYSNCAIKRRI